MKNRRWVVDSRPDGIATEANFRVEEEDLPILGDGEFLIETAYLRMNPPLRMALVSGGLSGQPIPLGTTMLAPGIGKVVESNNPDFKTGDLVSGPLGWQEFAISDGKTKTPVQPLAQRNDVPATALMHVMGPAGLTAYFGMYDYCKPKKGDTLVVSTAAGVVGSIMCQLGKLEGCRVVGIAGSREKCDWVVDELGADAAIDYHTEDVPARLAELCPDGIDIYFDNVGGEILDAALALIAQGARVVLCGASSQYPDDLNFYGPKNYFNLVYKQASMYGFFINNFADRFDEARDCFAKHIADGNLKYAEDVVQGFDQVPAGFERLQRSENFGAQLVQLKPL